MRHTLSKLLLVVLGLGLISCGTNGPARESRTGAAKKPAPATQSKPPAETPTQTTEAAPAQDSAAPATDVAKKTPPKPRPPKRTGPLRVLVFTGSNNHKWQQTTPVLKRIFNESPSFKVDVTDDPAGCTADTFAKYDVIVSNWCAFPDMNARKWGADTEKALMDFVRGGKGFVVFHAASATFHSWDDFQDLVGATWGKGTGHGPVHSFRVTIADPDHPVMRGLKPFWTTDELWHRMPTRAGAKPLCLAHSDKKYRGTGEAEPVALYTRMGAGRGFNLVLGHDVRAIENAGWRALMLRGTEWAATGDVTQPPPDDLPTMRLSLEQSKIDIAAALNAIRKYEPSQKRDGLLKVEELTHLASATPSFKKRYIPELVKLLESDATTDCKNLVCAQLSLVGGDSEVPALAALLPNEDTSLAARSALERIAGDASLDAIRSALKNATGLGLVGLINTLATLRDAKAVDALAPLATNTDETVAAAALDALGEIATSDAAKALIAAAARVPSGLKVVAANAQLKCAAGLMRSGDTANAERIYEELSSTNEPKHIRTAAFPGLVACQPQRASSLLGEALKGSDRAMQLAAARCIEEFGSREIIRAAAASLADLPPDVKASIIIVLGKRGDGAALSAVLKETNCDNATVRRAALDAIGFIGDAAAVKTLAERAAAAQGPEQVAARNALTRLKGDDIHPEMIRLLGSSASPLKRELIVALSKRRAREAVPALITAVTDTDAQVSKEAARALGDLADASSCRTIVDLMQKAGPSGARKALEVSLAAVCRRQGGAAALRGLTSGVDVKTRGSLLRVLGMLGGKDALAQVRAAIKDSNKDVRAAAVRALSAWPSGEALSDLLGLATTSDDVVLRTLALRGFARLAASETGMKPEKLAALYTKAIANAARSEDKKALISGLGKVYSPQALKLAASLLDDRALANEAAFAVVQIARVVYAVDRIAARAAVMKAVEVSSTDVIRQKADEVLLLMEKRTNLALGAEASSPDGHNKDGASGGDQAAIDGKENTYWDEADGQKLYRLVVTFPMQTPVGVIKIVGFNHHDYAPKDFRILCDGKEVKSVRNARYDNNRLTVTFPPAVCTTLELSITGYYGASPAIRELEVYPSMTAGKRTTGKGAPGAPATKNGWQKTGTSLARIRDGRVLWKYNFDRREGKPYFHPLCHPDGTELTWLRPGDHKWHRSMWFSWKFINGLNYWEENRQGLSQGRTTIKDITIDNRDDGSARIDVKLEYHPPGKPSVMREERSIVLSAPQGDGTYEIDWQSKFTALTQVKLDRTPLPGERGGKGWGGYAGLSLRLAKATRGWKFTDAEGRVDKAAHGKPSRWMAFSGKTSAGNDGVVAMFDAPSNPRHPTPWYVEPKMPYTGAAMIFNKPHDMASGDELNLKYRVIVTPGRLNSRDIDKSWKSFSR